MVDLRFRQLQSRAPQDNGKTQRPDGLIGQDIGRIQEWTNTFEVPFTWFGPDIVVNVNSTVSIAIPPRCMQVAFISLIPGVAASINGGGGRTIKDGFVFNGKITAVDVATDATGTVIVQLAGY